MALFTSVALPSSPCPGLDELSPPNPGYRLGLAQKFVKRIAANLSAAVWLAGCIITVLYAFWRIDAVDPDALAVDFDCVCGNHALPIRTSAEDGGVDRSGCAVPPRVRGIPSAPPFSKVQSAGFGGLPHSLARLL
jgi:hypothetical protein